MADSSMPGGQPTQAGTGAIHQFQQPQQHPQQQDYQQQQVYQQQQDYQQQQGYQPQQDYQQQQYQQQQQSPNGYDAEKPVEYWEDSPRVCGLRKKTFWLVMAVVAFAIATGVGIGLGLGLTKRNAGSSDSSSSTASTSSPSSSSASPTRTSSTAVPSPTRSVDSICPGGNNTLVVPDLGTMQYRVLCDRDFEAQRQTDASSADAKNFNECLILCDTLNSFSGGTDIAASFNAAGVGGEPAGTCWCIGDPDKLLVEKLGNDIAFALPIVPDATASNSATAASSGSQSSATASVSGAQNSATGLPTLTII